MKAVFPSLLVFLATLPIAACGPHEARPPPLSAREQERTR